MSRASIALLAIPALLAAAPAAAQYGDYGPPAGPPPVNYGPAYARAPFTGLRVEGIAGYDNLHNDGNSNGATYGVGLGYDMQFGGLVAGIEGEVTDSSVHECYGSYTIDDPRFCARLDRDFYAGGRLGAALSPRLLAYGKVGYTNARIRVTANEGFGRFTLGHEDLDGVRLGAGLEFNVIPNGYIKAEYRYSNYEQGFDRNQVVGGVGIRF